MQAFIAKCQELKMTGQASYWLTTEGDLGERKTACVDPNIVRARECNKLANGIVFPLGRFHGYKLVCYNISRHCGSVQLSL